MQPLTAIRHRRRRWAGLVLGLLVVTWGHASAAPCMAGDGGHDRGHVEHCDWCPKGTGHEGTRHDDGGCSYIDGMDYDGRLPQLPSTDFCKAYTLAVTTVESTATRGWHRTAHSIVQAQPHPPRRLHLEFCSLLN